MLSFSEALVVKKETGPEEFVKRTSAFIIFQFNFIFLLLSSKKT